MLPRPLHRLFDEALKVYPHVDAAVNRGIALGIGETLLTRTRTPTLTLTLTRPPTLTLTLTRTLTQTLALTRTLNNTINAMLVII